jgi:hypothetical protein
MQDKRKESSFKEKDHGQKSDRHRNQKVDMSSKKWDETVGSD